MSASGAGTAKSDDFKIVGKRVLSDDEETRLELVPRKPARSEGVVESGIVSRAPVISIDDVYRAPEAGTQLGTVLRLLFAALSNCEESISAIREGDRIRADDVFLRVVVVLPELFCCRSLGDGFAEIINAIQSAYENLEGELFALNQIQAIGSALSALRNEPRMSFDKALVHVSAMENVGLKTEPADVDQLAGLIDG